MKNAIVFIILFVVFPLATSAQQKADVEIWQKEYADRIQSTLERRLTQKPEFSKDLQFTKPDYVVFVPSVEADKLGDTYDDHFQVFDKPNGKLFAVWCQATCEGALDQHIAFSRSFDKGKTWEPPRVLAGNRTIAEGLANGGAIASWAFPLVSKTGRIYMLYNQFIPGKVSTLRQHTGIMLGIYSDDDGANWTKPEEIAMPRSINDSPDVATPSEWVVWQKPLRLGNNGNYIVGVSRYAHPSKHGKYRTLTEFIHFDNVDKDPPIKDLVVRWVQTNDKALHIGVHCEEPAIVKLPDNRLFCVMRTGIGTPCWTQSKDDGETWSEPKTLLMKDGGDPIPHPMSPCPIYDAKGNEAASGLYFLLAHNKFHQWNKNPWQNRGPLFLFAGRFQKEAEQPVWFDGPKRFIDRPSGNSFYTSLTVLDGKTVLWYPDQKFYLLGKIIGDEYFDGKPDVELYKPGDLDLSQYSIREHVDGKPLRAGASPKLELKNGAEQGVFKETAKIFSDRGYEVIQCPKSLNGKKFVRGSIRGVEVVCHGDGMLYVLTPMKDRNRDDQSPMLLKNGFEKVAQPETLLYELLPDGLVTLYQKEVKDGETIKLGQWAVIVF